MPRQRDGREARDHHERPCDEGREEVLHPLGYERSHDGAQRERGREEAEANPLRRDSAPSAAAAVTAGR